MRNNIVFELKQQELIIDEIKLINYDEINNYIEFSCLVSKGTYLRSLCVDI